VCSFSEAPVTSTIIESYLKALFKIFSADVFVFSVPRIDRSTRTSRNFFHNFPTAQNLVKEGCPSVSSATKTQPRGATSPPLAVAIVCVHYRQPFIIITALSPQADIYFAVHRLLWVDLSPNSITPTLRHSPLLGFVVGVANASNNKKILCWTHRFDIAGYPMSVSLASAVGKSWRNFRQMTTNEGTTVFPAGGRTGGRQR